MSGSSTASSSSSASAASAGGPFAADYAAEAGGFGTGPDAVAKMEKADAQKSSNLAKGMQAAGLIASVGGMVTSAINAYYKAKAIQHEAKSQASSFDFKSDMKALEASIARDDVGAIKRAGHHAKATVTMRAGMEMAKQLTRQGARGITIGKGSAAESMMSDELIKDIDAYTIDSNTLRQAQARRMQVTNIRAQGLLAGVSAQNLRGSVQHISPGWAGVESFMGGASTVSKDISSMFMTG